MLAIARTLVAAIRALPACPVAGYVPEAYAQDSHGYAAYAEAEIGSTASDIAWAIAGLATTHAEATDAAGNVA